MARKLEFAEHGQHGHSDKEKCDDLDQHLQTKPRECGAILNAADGVAHQLCAETIQKRTARTITSELHLFAKARLHDGREVADTIRKPLINALLADEDLACEQIGVVGQFRAPS